MNFVNLKIALDFITGTTDLGGQAPTFGDVLSQNLGILILAVVFSLVTLAGKYLVWVKIFGKKDIWKCFIPVYDLYFLFRAVDVNPYFAFAAPLPVLGLVPLALFNFYLPRAFGMHNIGYRIAAIFMPWVILLIIGLDQQYEYQYVKGKNVPFKNAFSIPTPGENGYDAAYTPNEVGAIGSQISQAAALNAANNERLRKEAAERAAREEAEKKAKQKVKLAGNDKQKDSAPTREVSYDIFDNGTMEQTQIHLPEDDDPSKDLPQSPLM